MRNRIETRVPVSALRDLIVLSYFNGLLDDNDGLLSGGGGTFLEEYHVSEKHVLHINRKL